MSSNSTKGIYLAIIAALISGIAIFVNKFAVAAIKPPLVFITIKNAGVGLLILGILLITGKWHKIKNLTKQEIICLILIGIIGGSIPFYLFFTGLSQIPAINAALIHKTLLVWVAILAITFLKEKLSKIQILAVLLLFSSNLLIGGFKKFQFSQGELFILIATVLWAIENILIKKIVSRVDPDLVIATRMGLGAVILLVAAAITSPVALSKSLILTSSQWFWLVLTMTTLLSCLMFWYRALKFAPATTVASVLVASTLVTNILSAVFITHTLNQAMIIQAILIIIGVGIFWQTAKNTAASSSSFQVSV